MRRLPLVLALFAFTACAHAPAPSPSQPMQASEPTEEHHHGEKGADRPIPLPHHLVDGKTGQALDEAALAARLKAAKVIYVGEEHPNPHDHAAELAVLEAAYAADPHVGLG